ncbi:Tcte1 [Symbiodinium pilosum]|uniref:Tcte1 protein n=1 Tax=Symbiodinium pilosum TaxID=2952 RepID=A0A812LRA8_SYMPI|nr:Tcte1 [Symbiodinium pilosum]
MAQDVPAAAPEASDRPVAATPELTSQAEWPWRKVESAAACEQKEAAAAEVPEDGLSFRRDLWDKFDYLWRERIEPSQGLLQKVADLLRSRAELERKYGESLLGFGADIQVEPGNPLHSAVDAMIVNFRNRGEQSITLADELEQDIIVCFDTVIKQHKEVSKKIQSDVQLVLKYAQDRRKAHDKLARRYGSRCAEAEYLAQDCLQAVSMKTADRMKLAQQATVLSKQARVAEYETRLNLEKLQEFKLLGWNELSPELLAEDELRLTDFQDPHGGDHQVSVSLCTLGLPSMNLGAFYGDFESSSGGRDSSGTPSGTLGMFMAGCGLTDASGEALGQLLKVSERLRRLSLNNNRLGCTAAACLSSGLQRNDFLCDLNLRQNVIADKGCCALAKALEVNPFVLETLDVSENHFAEAGQLALEAGFHASSSLAKLHLGRQGGRQTVLEKSPAAAVGLEGAAPLPQPVCPGFEFVVHCHSLGAEICATADVPGNLDKPAGTLVDMQQDDKDLDLVFSVPRLASDDVTNVSLSATSLKITTQNKTLVNVQLPLSLATPGEVNALQIPRRQAGKNMEYMGRRTWKGQERANRAQRLYDQQMSHVLEVLQDMEDKRGRCLRDGLRKLAVYETSWLRNMQYDLEGAAKAAEDCDAATAP